MGDTVRFVFLVTGSRDKRTVLFDHNARFRMIELVEDWNRRRKTAPELQPLPAVVRFIHFDFDATTVHAYEHRFEEKKTVSPRSAKQAWGLLSAFSSTAGTANDDPKSFVDTATFTHDGADVFSITNVYHSVRSAPKGSVLEVGMFSHGFVEGPVLINSGDDPTRSDPHDASLPARLPTDFDGRALKDFAENMGEDSKASATGAKKSGGKNALQQFKDALAPQATMRVYGCNAQDKIPGDLLRASALSVINQAWSVRGDDLRKSTLPKDDLEFKLNMWHATLIEGELEDQKLWKTLSVAKRNQRGNDLLTSHRTVHPDFFPAPNPDRNKAPAVKTVTVTFKDIRRFLARRLQEAYFFKAAEKLTPLGVAVHGAVPGVGGNNEPNKKGFGQMRVCAAVNKPLDGCNHSFGSILFFYKKFMKIKLDKRNFAILDAATVTAINDFAKP
jgi:hypothetical protein